MEFNQSFSVQSTGNKYSLLSSVQTAEGVTVTYFDSETPAVYTRYPNGKIH